MLWYYNTRLTRVMDNHMRGEKFDNAFSPSHRSSHTNVLTDTDECMHIKQSTHVSRNKTEHLKNSIYKCACNCYNYDIQYRTEQFR